MSDKLFIIRKYVWAKSAADAIKKEVKYSVEDVWIDEEWKKNGTQPNGSMGFYVKTDGNLLHNKE